MPLFDGPRREYAFARGMFRVLRHVTPMARRKTWTVVDAVADWARRYGDRPALLSARESLSFRDIDSRANRYARWARQAGIGKGDVVCLLMPNRPEYPVVWLGIARTGGVTALLNTQLTGPGLAHCINIVQPRHVIVAAELAGMYQAAAPLLAVEPRVWSHGPSAHGWPRVDEAVDRLDGAPLAPGEGASLTLDDRCLYIYTSGTTGLPKAANLNHYRVYGAMVAFSAVIEATARDRIYDCLPLYHTSGGVIAVGACLVAGGSAFIAERFSARQFWDDVVDNGCTRFQYIGELCRYLVNAPDHPKERQHKVGIVCGNGLRPDVWPRFRDRFRIPKIREFYAATEGNAILINFDGAVGAVGRVPRWARSIFPITSVRFDLDRQEPVRGEDGLCIECADDEVGEVVSKIVIDPMKPGQRFEGYADRAETERKILRDVFVAGDMWFRSGDLMRRDRHGYFHFVDRIGDTFRWKGENVSTSEVSEALTVFPGVRDANVYGVAIPGADGRAGMVALVADDGFDLAGFRDHIRATLPAHARPLFVRLQAAIDTTATFKQRKLHLVREGFDPAACSDPLYFDHPSGAFVRVDAALHAALRAGAFRL